VERFGNLTPVATGDQDADGQTNFFEYQHGANPASAFSRFQVTSAPGAAGALQLTWPTTAGRAYARQYSRNLSAWRDHPTTLVATGPSTTASSLPPTTRAVTFVGSTTPYKVTNWRGGTEALFATLGGDTAWTTATMGVGYENDTAFGNGISNVPFNSYFTVDLRAAMLNITQSAYLRIPFNVEDRTTVSSLLLQARCDDGFAAWLNGVPLVQLNTPANPAWNAGASTSTSDTAGLAFRSYDLTSFRSALVTGRNILAIQATNAGVGSSDFLFEPNLSGGITEPANQRVYWRVQPR
jgi:hypothetical protein